MKRKVLLITLAALTILFCSCEQEKPPRQPTYEKITSSEMNNSVIETGTVAGDYIYKTAVFSSYNLLLKYHIPTGTASTVCQDPFCTHNTMACPFSIQASGMASIGNILYYMVRVEGKAHIRSYNGDDMEIDEIYISDGVLSHLFSYNGYLFFSEKLPTKNEAECRTTVYRLDTQSDTLETIDCGHPSATIHEIKDSKIIWKESNTYFSTDLDGNNEEVVVFHYSRQWGNYIFRWEWPGKYVEKMYCKDLATGQEILIADEDIDFFFFYGEKIIYCKPVEDPKIFVTIDGIDYYDTLGGNVYVMNLNGSDKRLLCHVDNCMILGTAGHRNNELCCGDWVGFITSSIYDGPHGYEFTDTDLLIVNVVTGEYKLIRYNPFE
ncbi:MAG: hypothetical protein IJW70_05025 [Clostridia bacterium]|nr:hypothetical protein [Clostridia bacterium]